MSLFTSIASRTRHLGMALSLCCACTRPPAGPAVPADQVWLTPRQLEEAHIELEPVAPRPVGGKVLAAGRVTFDDLRVAHVFSPVTGRITRILVQPGEAVKKDQPLCVISSPDLGSAASDRAKARAALVQAEKDYRRQRELYELHAGTQRDFEAAEASYQAARAELERAERKARLFGNGDGVTQTYTLTAPIAGEVIQRGANPGLEVQGQYGGGAAVELFTIGAQDSLWVLADVYDLDLPRVKKGAPVSFRVLSYPEQRFAGAVEWISGALDPTSRSAKVRFTVDNRAGLLRPELFGTAEISVAPETRLALRRSALLLLGEQPVVFAVVGTAADGRRRFERRVVAIDDMAGGDYVPLRGGLSKDETVVVSGGILLLGML